MKLILLKEPASTNMSLLRNFENQINISHCAATNISLLTEL